MMISNDEMRIERYTKQEKKYDNQVKSALEDLS